MIIGVDVDGVLTKLEKYQLVEGERYFKIPPVNKKGYKIYQIFGLTLEDDRRFWHDNIFSYATYDTVQVGSAEVLKKLKADGHTVIIVTARTFTREDSPRGEKMRKIMNDWLSDNDVVYDKIVYSEEDKTEICKRLNLDVMIEDCVDNILNVSKSIPVICMDAIYNKEAQGNNIFRAYGWKDVYPIVCKLIKR